MQPSCTTRFGAILLEGMQEVIGVDDLQAFFRRTTFPADRLMAPADSGLAYQDLGAFQHAVEAAYGATGGRGLLLRSGRAAFRALLPAFWKQIGMTNLQYRLNPTPVRIRTGLSALARVLSDCCGQQIELADDGDAWRWSMHACPFCFDRQTSGPVCDFVVGILQEYLSWTSSGRFYMVEEVECLGAGGQSCGFLVWKKPLD